MSENTFSEPNQEHLERLRRGGPSWNAWRNEYPDVVPLLRMADLTGVDLRGADLSNAEFGSAFLSKANLSGCKLYQAEFFTADLQGANLNEADLRGAKFHNADLRGASLQFSDLFRADFIGTRLKDANLRHARCWTTAFSNVDLSEVIGLSEVIHTGPSSVDIATLINSGSSLPKTFLRGVGVPDVFIDYLPSLLDSMQSIEFYSCFISYSSKDETFAKKLHRRMLDDRLRVWFAPEDMIGGKKIYEQIDNAIKYSDKLLIVLSENSIRSEWVISEIRNARRAEVRENKQKLFPISLIDYELIKDWVLFDADTGTDLAIELREYFIPDFSKWNHSESFESAYGRLLDALKTG